MTPDGRRLIGVGPLLEAPNGLLPSRSRGEKRLIGKVLLVPVTLVNDVPFP